MNQIHAQTIHPIIVIASTNSKVELSSIFLRLFLQCHRVGNLNKTNREQLFKWMLKRDSVKLDSTMINKIIDNTSNFNYMNYMTLLMLSTK